MVIFGSRMTMDPAQFFAGIGASTNYCKVTGILNNPLYTTDMRGVYSTQTSPLVEAGFKLSGRGNLDRVFLMLRMDAYSFSNHKDYTVPLNQYRITFSGFVLGFPISIGYRVIKTPFVSLDLSAGASGLILLDNKQKQDIHDPPYTGSTF